MNDEDIINADGKPTKLKTKQTSVIAKPSSASLEADIDALPLLSEEEKLALRRKARDNVLADMKKEAENAFLSKEERKELIRRKQKTGQIDMDEEVEFVCNLAEYATHILVNNVAYYHGFSYKVPRHVCRDLMAIADKTWDHDADIHGEKWNPRRKKNVKFSMRDVA